MKLLNRFEFNAYANDPELLREQGWTGGALDNVWFFENPHNFALEEDGCCIPFICKQAKRMPWPVGVGDGTWHEIHFLFPKDRRGKRAADAARAMVKHALTERGVALITGTIPRRNLAARMVIRHLGFAPVGTCELAGEPAITYALDKAQCPGLQEPPSA